MCLLFLFERAFGASVTNHNTCIENHAVRVRRITKEHRISDSSRTKKKVLLFIPYYRTRITSSSRLLHHRWCFNQWFTHSSIPLLIADSGPSVPHMATKKHNSRKIYCIYYDTIYNIRMYIVLLYRTILRFFIWGGRGRLKQRFLNGKQKKNIFRRTQQKQKL